MKIGGVSIILLLGMINFALLVFQVSTGLRFIKVPFGVHRKTGILLLITATIHGALALLAD